MLIRYWEDILRSPALGIATVLIVVATLLFSLSFHEFSHAFVSLILGDTEQVKRGRLTLNPLRHLDPVGTLLLLFAGFGWAKPVMSDESKLRPSPEVGMAMVGAAGPLSNLLIAVLVAIPVRLGFLNLFSSLQTPFGVSVSSVLGTIAYFLITWNIVLAVFNSIPIPPLDGSWVARLLLPKRWRSGPAYGQISQWGMVLFFGLIGLSFFTPYDVFGTLIGAPLEALTTLIVGRSL